MTRMNSKPHPRSLSAHTLMLALVCLLMPARRSFCAESTAAPTPAATPVLATNFVLVTNVVVVTNYVVTTNTFTAIPDAPTLQRSNAPTPALPDLSWVPPEDGFDWIQLRSGEWLKGSIKAMQERTLEFDSEELKLLTFDWKDIRQVRSQRSNELLYGDKQKATGPISITPEQVTVGGAEPRTFPRSQLQSITPGGSRERNYWSGKVTMGLTLRSGNTKSVDYDAQINLQRRTPETRLKFDYLGNVSIVDDVENANNHRVNAEFDYWLSRRFYLILPQAEYFKDPFQHIAHRLTVGGGAGYDLFDRPGLEWNVSTGPAYQRTWFDSVQAGEASVQGQAALTFGSKFDWQITRRIELILEYRGQYTSREVGETFHHAVSTLSVELTKRFDLDVSFVWDRTQIPKPDSNDVVPKQDDFRLIVGLGVRF
jgi:putative salt-induced outer membrane protein YdiY